MPHPLLHELLPCPAPFPYPPPQISVPCPIYPPPQPCNGCSPPSSSPCSHITQPSLLPSHTILRKTIAKQQVLELLHPHRAEHWCGRHGVLLHYGAICPTPVPQGGELLQYLYAQITGLCPAVKCVCVCVCECVCVSLPSLSYLILDQTRVPVAIVHFLVL